MNRFRLAAFLANFAALFGAMSAADEPRAFTSVAVLHDEDALAGAHDVELQGHFAYVPGKGGSLAIIDIADPAKPRIVWSKRDSQLFDDGETVLPAGDHLFLGTRDFLVLDIRDPAQPQVRHTISDRNKIDRINGFARRGDVIFAANKEGWLDAFDVSSPARPRLVAALNIAERDGIGKPHDVDWLGEYLLVVDPAGFGRRRVPGHVGVYRVLDPSSGAVLPPGQWSLVGKAADERLVGGNRVRGMGSFAFVAASLSPQAIDQGRRQGCVAVVDLADLQNCQVVATVPFPDVRGPNGMETAGRVIFAAGGQTIMAIDVTDPRHPQVLAARRCPEVFHGEPGLDDGHDLEYRDGYLYVTGQTSNTFGILRIDDARIRRLADARP